MTLRESASNVVPAAGPPKIMIVDDELAHMNALCETLGDRGYVTCGCPSAGAALDILKNEDFDLLLTDLMMPDIDGISLLNSALKMQPMLVGIVMTGHGTIDTAVAAMKTGALDYILKPFKLSAVLPVLERALSVRRLRLENAELQERVKERTQQLEAANRDLESFAWSLSHDLLAPLRAVRGYAELLEKEFAVNWPEEARTYLGRVSVSAERMEQLARDLLQFSRSGQAPLRKEKFSVAAVAGEVVTELRAAHPDRRVEFVLKNPPDAFGDPSLLRQVFVNLLSNAFKFTREREVATIELGGAVREGFCEYFVRDNGAGFSMQQAERLFGVFQRLDTSDRFEGTGVGLSIVKKVVERHGGRTLAEGVPDKGAVFWVWLPSADK